MVLIFLIALEFALLQESQPQPEGNVTIAEIKTAWAETEAKTTTCRFKWTESRQTGDNEATNHFYKLLLQNSDHLRIEKVHRRNGTIERPSLRNTYVTTYDAKTAKTYAGKGSTYGRKHRTGFVSFQPSGWDNYHVLPILMAVRPINKHFSPISEFEYSVVADPIEIEGRELLELRPAKSDVGFHYIYYVDPLKNFAISRVVKNSSVRKQWQLDLSHRKVDESGCWLPDSWKLTDDSSNLKTVVEKVDGELNTDFADDQFDFEFPAHTLITDRTFADPLVYILCDDGRKLVMSPEERKEGIAYLDYVAAAQSKTNSDQAPVPNWPLPLSEAGVPKKIFETHKAEVSVRFVPKCTHFGVEESGYYISAPAESEIIDQLKASYNLEPVKHTHDFVEGMAKGLPLAFRVERPEDLEWHESGLGDDGNVGSWFVLGINRRSNTLYFFTASWDYAP